jgi:hypothetical protein
MSKLIQILKSEDLESRERHVERLKKEIDDLNVTLEVNLEALEKLRSSTK